MKASRGVARFLQIRIIGLHCIYAHIWMTTHCSTKQHRPQHRDTAPAAVGLVQLSGVANVANMGAIAAAIGVAATLMCITAVARSASVQRSLSKLKLAPQIAAAAACPVQLRPWL